MGYNARGWQIVHRVRCFFIKKIRRTEFSGAADFMRVPFVRAWVYFLKKRL